MKNVIFLVDEAHSYVKYPFEFQLNPGVKAPLIVHLHEGGSVNLTIEEKLHIAHGDAEYLWFTTDKLQECGMTGGKGNAQAFGVKMGGLNFQYEPKTGHLLYGSATLSVYREPHVGGIGYHGQVGLAAPSKFIDANSAPFDFSNGLGCGGGIQFEFQSGNNERGPDFYIHIEGKVSMEDVDGDGAFEVVCHNVKRKLWLERKPPIPPDIPSKRRRPHLKHKLRKRLDKVRV